MATADHRVVDLRSDTCSLPSAEMREAMLAAALGNDMFREDPSVNELEKRVATMLGAEDAVLMPTGVMANQIGLWLHLDGNRPIGVGKGSHVHCFEDLAANGINDHLLLPDHDDQIFLSAARAEADSLCALAIENTHLTREGHVSDLNHHRALARIGIPIHLDGARLMNAAAALDVELAAIAQYATTIMLTLSKGFGAPLGSLLAGPQDLMARARQRRTTVGGALAQAGWIAAPGLIALERSPEGFRADHRRAARFRRTIEAMWPGSTRPRTSPGTNIVLFSPPDPAAVVEKAAAQGLLLLPWGDSTIRAVFHATITDSDLERAQTVITST